MTFGFEDVDAQVESVAYSTIQDYIDRMVDLDTTRLEVAMRAALTLRVGLRVDRYPSFSTYTLDPRVPENSLHEHKHLKDPEEES